MKQAASIAAAAVLLVASPVAGAGAVHFLQVPSQKALLQAVGPAQVAMQFQQKTLEELAAQQARLELEQRRLEAMERRMEASQGGMLRSSWLSPGSSSPKEARPWGSAAGRAGMSSSLLQQASLAPVEEFRLSPPSVGQPVQTPISDASVPMFLPPGLAPSPAAEPAGVELPFPWTPADSAAAPAAPSAIKQLETATPATAEPETPSVVGAIWAHAFAAPTEPAAATLTTSSAPLGAATSAVKTVSDTASGFSRAVAAFFSWDIKLRLCSTAAYLVLILLFAWLYGAKFTYAYPSLRKAPLVTREHFSFGLFEGCRCDPDWRICFFSCFCTPVRWADTASSEKIHFLSFWTALLLFTGLSLLPQYTAGISALALIAVAVVHRQRMRAAYDLPRGTCGTVCGDLLTWIFCAPCATMQEAMEVEFVNTPEAGHRLRR